MIRFAENLNKMITAGLGGAMEAPSTEVAVGHCIRYLKSSGAVASFETNIAAPIRSLRVDMQPIQAGSGDPSPDNVRPISGRESVTVWREASYDPSADPALTIQLGQTVYGGTVDVTAGTMEVEYIRRIFDGTETGWSWYANYQQLSLQNAFTDTPAEFITSEVTYLCDSLTPYPNSTAAFHIGNYARLITNGLGVAFSTPATTEADAKAYLTAHPVTFVYKLATPQTITLTPAQLSTLAGENNIWSDAGDVSLEYPYYEETEGY